MSLDTKRLRRLRRLSDVPRWTVIPTIQKQSVAEHSFNVAAIALWLAEQHKDYQDGSADELLLFYAMVHDETEAITGDIPSPARGHVLPGKSDAYEIKKNHGAHALPQELKDILKIADLLDAWWFIQDEEAMGNTRLRSVMDDVCLKIGNALNLFPTADGQHWSVILTRFAQIIDPKIHPAMESE